MKKILLFLPFLVILGCGDDTEAGDTREAVKLVTFEDKISYSLGAMEAKKITESPNPNASRLDKKMLLAGYKEGFKPGMTMDQNNPCMKTMESLFGIQGMDFDTTYVREGSKCYGSTMAGMFYKQLEDVSEVKTINKELFYRGFEDGLAGNDTVISDVDKKAVVDQFGQQVQKKMQAEMQNKLSNVEMAEAADWVKIKAITGIVELEEGVYLQTLKKGKGVSPTATDDVEASYILSTLDGTVKQNSADFGETFKTNLSGVVQGWTIGFQAMQKGGKYKLYVPARMGYGEETLIFEIEVFNIGPAGSIAPPRQ